MHRFFYAIHSFVSKNKALSVGIFACVFLVLGLLSSRIRFSEDITKLIPAGKSDVTAKVLNQVNFADKITVLIDAKNGASTEVLAAFADAFTDSVQINCAPDLKNIQGRLDEDRIAETVDFVYNHLPLFLSEQDYRALDRKIQDSVGAVVEGNFKSLVSPSGLVTRDLILQDPLGMSFLGLRKLQQLNLGDEFTLENGYIFTRDKQKLLLFLTPRLPSTETDRNTAFAAKLYAIKDRLNTEFKGQAEAQYFGSALIAVANAKQIKSDIIWSTSIAMTALMLILILFYRKIFIPLIIFLPTLFGAVFAVALLYLVKGTISAISLGIGSILIGITIDYSLHILTHYKHNSDVRHLYKDITMPLIMSSTTTAIAFLCLLFVHSEALQDLGIFAAAITVSSAFFSLLFVPHLYKPRADNFAHTRNWIDRLAGVSFHKNKFLIGGCALVIMACFFTYDDVAFNNDLSQLNFIPKDQREAEKQLEQSTNLTSKSIYLAAYGNDLETVLQRNSNLSAYLDAQQSSGNILNFSSVGGIVLSKSDQQQKIARWNAFWTASKKAQVKAALIKEGARFGFKPTTYERFFDRIDAPFQTISVSEYARLQGLELSEFVASKNGFYTVSTLVKVDNAKRDAFVRHIGDQAGVLAIDRQQMNETFLGNLNVDFTRLVNYSFIAVVLILFVFFRRIELVLVATIPIAITAIVTAGIMGMFNIRFNIFSMIVCTLVFGHGVDFSIFMTSALQKQYTDGKNEIAIYRTSIILAVITTILGIGALIFAKHPALTSISSISLIGVLAALVITFIFYPILFRLVISGRAQKGKAPFQLLTFVHSIISFAYFGLGGLLMSFLSVLVRIIPGNRQKKMLAWRWLMSKYMGSVLYTNLFVRKKVNNPHGERFEKPAVIIANHTSFLDILAVGMLSPKVIYLVSDWVYRSPVFGKAVRAAGFYPVSSGIEGGVGHLREKIEQGYSLVVFPEGTRSTTNQIQRFHKGAFYLADHFQIDVLPVLIHGNSEALPKGDFIIYDGSITVDIGARITPQDMRFGNNYADRTKKIAAFFKSEFKQLRARIEGPRYFEKMLLHSFDYKEWSVVSSVRADVAQHLEHYFELGQWLGDKDKILHIADDYGQLDIYLALQQPARKITSFIADADKREVARTNYLVRKRHLNYIESLSQTMDATYDATLISTPRDFEQLADFAPKVILWQCPMLEPPLVALGYQTRHVGAFTVLTRSL